jgi:hypothetical protein
VEKYRQRTYNEDVAYLEELGTVQGLAEKLATSCETGIDPSEEDTKNREESFGTNYKAPS